MNSCTFTGVLGKDWVKKEAGSTQIYNNSMAIKKYDKTTMWINIKSFGKQGEVLAQYTGKGSHLSIESEIDINEYQGKWYTSFKINKFTFCGGKKKENNQPQQQNNQPPEDDDIPF